MSKANFRCQMEMEMEMEMVFNGYSLTGFSITIYNKRVLLLNSVQVYAMHS